MVRFGLQYSAFSEMMRKVKHLVSIVVLVFLLLSLAKDGLVQAQGEAVVLSQLRIDLWPEHDRPNMLVIYKAVLGSDVTLPVSLTFRIPAAAGEPNGVAYPWREKPSH
jgi:hypothetical protein